MRGHKHTHLYVGMGQPAATCVTSLSLCCHIYMYKSHGVTDCCTGSSVYVCVDRGTEMRKSCLLRHTARARKHMHLKKSVILLNKFFVLNKH